MADSVITSSLSAIPDTIRALIASLRNLELSSKTRYVLSAAALVIILKFLLKSKSKNRGYVSNLDKVGQRVGVAASGVEDSNVDAEYDIIIVGGGTDLLITQA
jgi:hypothetical protein